MSPVWRTHELFWKLGIARSLCERVHHHWRVRYRVAGDDAQMRPKRRGIGVQRLRAQAALLVEWLSTCWRHGWLSGSADRNRNETTSAPDWDAERQLRDLINERRKSRLHRTYGTPEQRRAARRRE